MKNKTILILGAGQIGEACALKSIKNNPKRIILHTLTKNEALCSLKNVQKHLEGRNIDIQISWGNALVTKLLMYLDHDELHTPENRKKLIKYYYSYLSDNLIKKSSLYYLVQKWRPDYIFDGINTATVVGYQDDPYSLPRKILNKKDGQDWNDSADGLLVSNIVPSLIRFTQALKKSLFDFNVKCYVKISTTGLGGMGDNLFYTHGDVNEPGMSSGILGKVAAAGVIHQLFWSLSLTLPVAPVMFSPMMVMCPLGGDASGAIASGTIASASASAASGVVSSSSSPFLPQPVLASTAKASEKAASVDRTRNVGFFMASLLMCRVFQGEQPG